MSTCQCLYDDTGELLYRNRDCSFETHSWSKSEMVTSSAPPPSKPAKKDKAPAKAKPAPKTGGGGKDSVAYCSCPHSKSAKGEWTIVEYDRSCRVHRA